MDVGDTSVGHRSSVAEKRSIEACSEAAREISLDSPGAPGPILIVPLLAWRLVMDEEHQARRERRPVLLFAFANDDRPGRRLEGLRLEIEEIRRVLTAAEREHLCEVVVRESITRRELVEVLEDPRYRRRLALVHFAGHAGTSQLLLEGEQGPVAARIEGLVPLLAGLEGLALVFLNGCGTQDQGEQLARAGVPAVVSTEHPVEDEQAQRFAVDFYRVLAGGASVAESFARARAQAQCFVCSPRVTRDLEPEPAVEHEEPPWRLVLADPSGDATDWSLPVAANDPLFGLPSPARGVLPQEPFMGLRRFTARESQVFFGRGRAIRNLHGVVTDPALPLVVVVHGAAGVGKSSLLEAGLLPRIAMGHEVHHARLERGQDPEVSLRRALGAEDDRVDLATAWRVRERAVGRPVVVCLDQLEALVLAGGRADALRRFVQALGPLAGPDRPRGKLLLGLRKEWFPELRRELERGGMEWHDHFVESLEHDDIEEVVLGPTRTASLRARYGISCEPELARRIADDLSQDLGSTIAPVLQILLTRLWEHAEPRRTSVDGHVRRRFTVAAYEALRREGLGLGAFVDRQLAALRETHARSLASGLVLDLLVHHTTPRGTAAYRTHAELRELYADRWPTIEGLVERCCSLYLLAAHTDADGVRVGVRLAHDTLAPIVRDRYRNSKAPGQAAARLLEARMGLSEAAGRARLLDVHDLALVEAAQSGMRRFTAQEQRLVEDSRRRRRRGVWFDRWRYAVLGVSLGIIAAVPWFDRPQAPATVTDRMSVSPASLELEPPAEQPPSEGLVDAPSQVSARPSLDEDPRGADEARAPEIDPPRAALAPGSSRPRCSLRRLPTGSAGRIGAMEATADGSEVALGMDDRKKAYVVDPLSSTSALVAVSTKSFVNRLAWSPTGRTLAVGQEKGFVQVVSWDAAGTAGVVACEGHGRSVRAVGFSRDGKSLMTAMDETGEVILWEGWAAGRCTPAARASLDATAFDLRSSASAWLVAGAGGRVLAWSPGGPAPTSVSIGSGTIHAVAPLSRARWVLAGSRLWVWDATEGVLEIDARLGKAAQRVFPLDEGGSRVLTASQKGVELWARAGTTMTQTSRVDIPGIEDVAVSRDGRDVLVADAGGSVRWLMVQPHGLHELRSLTIGATRLSTLVVDPALRYFVVGDVAGEVTLVDLPDDRAQARECEPHGAP